MVCSLQMMLREVACGTLNHPAVGYKSGFQTQISSIPNSSFLLYPQDELQQWFQRQCHFFNVITSWLILHSIPINHAQGSERYKLWKMP